MKLHSIASTKRTHGCIYCKRPRQAPSNPRRKPIRSRSDRVQHACVLIFSRVSVLFFCIFVRHFFLPRCWSRRDEMMTAADAEQKGGIDAGFSFPIMARRTPSPSCAKPHAPPYLYLSALSGDNLLHPPTHATRFFMRARTLMAKVRRLSKKKRH